GLARIVGSTRIAGGHGAEATAAGARVAEEHHRGGALAPALAHVGTARLLAHGVKVEAPQRLLERVVGLAAGGADLEPGRLRRETSHHGSLSTPEGAGRRSSVLLEDDELHPAVPSAVLRPDVGRERARRAVALRGEASAL